MPLLTSPQEELFAQRCAAGQAPDEAARYVGYKTKGAGAKLLTRGHIAERVKELQFEGAKNAGLSAETLIRYADEARRLAMELEQPSAAVSAVREMGTLAGLRVSLVQQRFDPSPPIINIVRFSEETDDGDA